MSYRDTFPRRNTFLTVVHVEDEEQMLKNVDIAQDNGADGVFLINHHIPYTELKGIYASVRLRYPSVWIGLNFLDLSPIQALEQIHTSASGLWVDNAMVEEHGLSLDAEDFKSYRDKSAWKGLYFGGVAFKYQPIARDFGKVAKNAIPYVDVVTTSGEGTGIAADPAKIRLMRKALGDHPLAVASGITPENVENYMPYVDCFLVATGVGSYIELDPSKVRQLSKIIRSS